VYQFSLTGVLNPYFAQDMTGLIISTSTIQQPPLPGSSYSIQNVLDQVIGISVTLQQYTPGSITVNAFTRQATATDAPTVITVNVTLASRLMPNATIQVYLPIS